MLSVIIFYLYAIFFPQLLGKSGEMRAVVRHNRRKGVELSLAIGTFLLMMFKYDFGRKFF